MGSKTDLHRQRKESTNLKIGQLRSSSLRNIKKKRMTKNKGPETCGVS